MQRVIIFSMLLFITIQAAAQIAKTPFSDRIDSLVAENYKAIAPGCVVLIAKEGQIMYHNAFGTANLELDVKMQPQMLFRIASMTKQYTAIAILKLVEEGKISLNDSVQRFVEGFPHKGHTITIEHLLTHTSGIVGYEVLDFHVPNAIRVDFSPKRLIESVGKLPLQFKPATRFNYSNTNYLMLGHIIEQVSGKSYEQYLQENVFKPAGLSNTCYDSPTQVIKNRITGYAKHNGAYRNAGYISMWQVFSTGALLANAEDLFRWHCALYAGKVVEPATLKKAITPYKLADGSISQYSYGWFIRDWKGSKVVGHGGAIDGFRSVAFYFPEKDMFLTALFNSEDDNYMALVLKITDLVLETLKQQP